MRHLVVLLALLIQMLPCQALCSNACAVEAAAVDGKCTPCACCSHDDGSSENGDSSSTDPDSGCDCLACDVVAVILDAKIDDGVSQHSRIRNVLALENPDGTNLHSDEFRIHQPLGSFSARSALQVWRI